MIASNSVEVIVMILTILVLALVVFAIFVEVKVRMQVNKAASQYQDRLRNNELVRVPNIPIEEIAVKLRQLMPFKKFDVTVTGDDINIRCYIDEKKQLYTITISKQNEYYTLHIKGKKAKYIVLKQIEDILSLACWGKHAYTDFNLEVELNDLKKKENLSLVSKIACLLGAIGWIGYISYAYTYINPIIALKASELNNTTITVGEMADEFFDNPKWKVRASLPDEDGFIDISGKCYHVSDIMGGTVNLVDLSLEFFYSNGGAFHLTGAKVDGESIDTDEIEALVSDLYKGHMENELIDGNGNLPSYGHYISYQSGGDINVINEQVESTEEDTTSSETTPAETEPSSVAQETTVEETTPEETSAQSGQQTRFATIDEYRGPFDISIIPNTVWSCTPDDMTSSKMTITENDDGSLHLTIEATSTHNPYVNNFSGNSVTISGAQDADLYIVFETDGQDPDGVGDQVEVTWYSMEAADFPQVKGGEDGSFLNDYLYDGQYNWEYDLQ